MAVSDRPSAPGRESEMAFPGRRRPIHVPHHQVQEVQRRLALRAELEAKVREILRLNLERWLAEKKPKP